MIEGYDLIEQATILAAQGDTFAVLHQLAEVLENRILIRKVRIQKAQDQRNLGNNERAEEILRLAISQAGGGSLLGELYHHLGTNAQGAKKFSEALEYLHIAFQLRQDSGDILGAAYTAFQIPMCKSVSGVLYENLLKEFAKAEEAIRAVLKDMGLSVSKEHAGNMFQNLAFCLQVKKEWADALDMYNTAMTYRELAEADKPENERRGTAMTLVRIAECYLELRQLDHARSEAEKALEVFEHLGDKNRIDQTRKLISNIEELERSSSAP